jgi:hypothetical protein
MPISPNNLHYLENGLHRRLPPGEQQWFDARLLTDASLRNDAETLHTACALVVASARPQLRAEIKALHAHLFTAHEHQSFRQKVMRIFGRK